MTAFAVRTSRTDELAGPEIAALRDLLWAAFEEDEHGGFDEDDWQHALGGMHFIGEVSGRIVSHAAVVPREIHVAGRPLRAGYVEAVATLPGQERRGYGSAVMRVANAHIDDRYELAALGTGSHGFYERLGWRTWQGPSFVRTPRGDVVTPQEDGYIMVRLTPSAPPLDLTAPISCEWRAGDVW